MNNTFPRKLKKYFRKIGNLLVCAESRKFVLMSEFKDSVYEYIGKHQQENITMSDIEENFGSPETIAKSFTTNEDLPALRKKARKLLFYRILAVILIVVLAFVIYLLVDLITRKHTITITNNFGN